MREKLKLVRTNLWEIPVEAILCQANTELEMEEETTKKIMEKGGDSIHKECNQIGNLEKGKAVITGAGKLPAKYILHAVLNDLNGEPEEEILMSAVREAFALAKEKKIKSVAVPIIGQSSDIPIKRAAELILTEIKKHLESETTIESVIFVANDYYSYDAFEDSIRQL